MEGMMKASFLNLNFDCYSLSCNPEFISGYVKIETLVKYLDKSKTLTLKMLNRVQHDKKRKSLDKRKFSAKIIVLELILLDYL